MVLSEHHTAHTHDTVCSWCRINGGYKGLDPVGNIACPNIDFLTLHVCEPLHLHDILTTFFTLVSIQGRQLGPIRWNFAQLTNQRVPVLQLACQLTVFALAACTARGHTYTLAYPQPAAERENV